MTPGVITINVFSVPHLSGTQSLQHNVVHVNRNTRHKPNNGKEARTSEKRLVAYPGFKPWAVKVTGHSHLRSCFYTNKKIILGDQVLRDFSSVFSMDFNNQRLAIVNNRGFKPVEILTHEDF